MDSKPQRLRLDEILTRQGKISETQLKVALKYQKIYGGKLASHILHHGFMTEAALVEALAEHFGCRGVVLSNLDIPKSTLELIPHSVAVAHRVIPFAYEKEKNLLRVACENPADEGLITELSHLTGIPNIQLSVAVEISLNLSISRHYGYEYTETKSPEEEAGKTANAHSSFEIEANPNEAISRSEKTVLLAVHDSNSGAMMKQILESSHYDVVVTRSIEEVIDLVAIMEFKYIFIQESMPGDHTLIFNRIREKYPLTKSRSFTSVADLILNNTGLQNECELRQNLELFTSLLTIKERLPRNYNPKFSHYVGQLCERLSLSADEKTLITNVAYLYDRAKFYFISSEPRDFSTLIKLATSLFQSMYYEPAVIEILRSMHIDLRKKSEGRISLELLGGNILTIVDLFCDALPSNRRITMDRFELIKAEFMTQVGSRLLEKVVDAFCSSIKEETLNTPQFTQIGQIMIYSDQPAKTMALDVRLRKEGFRTILAKSLDSFYHLYERSEPDMLVLHLSGGPRDIIVLTNSLVADGIDIKKIPTILMVEDAVIPSLTSLCERGVEEIVDKESNIDLVILKINKIHTHREEGSSTTGDSSESRIGSRGSLSDMNLIDLLQALGPGQRTTKLLINPSDGGKDRLEIFLDRGNIVFARLGDLQGAEAIYAGMTWEDGTWVVEPITRQDLVHPNTDLSNESILMEGCRLMDELNQRL